MASGRELVCEKVTGALLRALNAADDDDDAAAAAVDGDDDDDDDDDDSWFEKVLLGALVDAHGLHPPQRAAFPFLRNQEKYYKKC